ncbi:hypothetical protein Afil01_58490 [Actinorhabdospora filicis]|uniref:Pyridoxamine 5'-phosphate oxidase N-terminal domain-containing protein n=1 Tax=Actinorhabdospora filicis TaxID=1785913 RepID=A0A9W6SRR4_9ACTN|nr:pyridoxamine 5'-phosphate oxidase family protein [Actinorhabdospora filicis]GLZ81042.1 hypothetical protein Afil01_58490 [Actinorhabdospora filicis]
MVDARKILEEYVSSAKAVQLATLSPDGAPAMCNLWCATAFAPDRLWFISRPTRFHCVNIRSDARVAGALLAIELAELGQPVRGVSFTGVARELPTSDVDDDIAAYVGRWPSAAGAIDPARLAAGETHHRIYRVEVTGWVLYDEIDHAGGPRVEIPAETA